MIEKTVSVYWEGPGKKGRGQIRTETGALERYPYGFASRFEHDRGGSNPEEIALAAKRECPLSKALASVAEISLQAKLETAAA
jgi:lipoyl-dependent peroxiredoxin